MGGGTSPDMTGSKNPDRRYELYKIKKRNPVQTKHSFSGGSEQTVRYASISYMETVHCGWPRKIVYACKFLPRVPMTLNRRRPRTFGVCLIYYWPLHAKLIG